MVSLQIVEEQLKRQGCNFKFWGRPEIRELGVVLMPDEEIAQCANGHYEGGFALLVATDRRVLLIDRKPMFLTLEAISYDMISQVDFNHRLLGSTINIYTFNKSLVFTTWNHKRLQIILHYTQQRVADIRQKFMSQMMQQQASAQVPMQPAYAGAQMAMPATNFGANTLQPPPLVYGGQTPLLRHTQGFRQ